jgi:hypothetical protein
MAGVLAENGPKVPLTGDQHPVQALTAGTGNPPFGNRVRTRRSMKNSTYRRRRNTVSTWKKSTARIVFAWASRNARQLCPDRLGAGSMPASLRICQTVDAAMVCPRPVSSP